MVVELGSNNPFDDFGDKGKVGDGAIIVEILRVEVGFFEDGYKHSLLELVWHGASGEREVHNVGEGLGEMGQRWFEKAGREGVERAGFDWGRGQDLSNGFGGDKSEGAKPGGTVGFREW